MEALRGGSKIGMGSFLSSSKESGTVGRTSPAIHTTKLAGEPAKVNGGRRNTITAPATSFAMSARLNQLAQPKDPKAKAR